MYGLTESSNASRLTQVGIATTALLCTQMTKVLTHKDLQRVAGIEGMCSKNKSMPGYV